MHQPLAVVSSFDMAIRQAYRVLVRAKSEQGLLQEVCQTLISGDAYVHAWVSQFNGAGQARTQASATPIPNLASRLGQVSVSSIERLCQVATVQVCKRRKPLILPGQVALQNDPFWVKLNRLVPSCRLVCVPILLDDLCLGALSILAVGGRASEDQEASLCQDLALDLAQTLESLRSQAVAQTQQVQMRSLIEHSPDAILAMDHQGGISYANPAAESLLGLSVGQLMHTSLGMPSNTGEVIVLEIPPKPDDVPGQARVVEATLLKPQTEQALTYVFLHEVTQRKKAQLLQARLGRILDRTSYMFLVFDAGSLRLLDISESCRHKLGYSNKQLRQMTLHNLKPDFSPEKFQSLLQPLRDAKVSELLFETFLFDAAGGNHPLEVRLQTAVEDEKVVLIALVLDISDRIRHMAELEHRANYDAVTDLPLRNILIDRLDQAIKMAQRNKHVVAVLTVQLSSLGEISSLMGYQVGDQLVAHGAKRLVSALRSSDTVARLLDSKFCIVMPDVSLEHVRQVAEKIQQLLQQPIVIDNLSLEVEASFGAALFPDHGKDVQELLFHSDIALNMARHHSDGLSIYSKKNTPVGLQRIDLLGELSRAIEDNELTLLFQPQLELGSGRICGVEALVRWPHPSEGMIMPSDFIPIAEQSGRIRQLTQWVLAQAIAQQSSWRKKGLDIQLSINLSMHNLFDLGLVESIESLLKEYRMEPGKLCLEVTESVVMSRPEQATRVLSNLNAMGVRLSIDDFGAGYSSLTYLKRLPVHELKIDKFFVTGMERSLADQAIVRAAISLAHNLGLYVVAEGVESQDTIKMLRDFGCEKAQGYAISHAMPGNNLVAWVSHWLG